MRVIVVDDMGSMRANVKKNLDALGFQDIETANNGRQAFDKIIAVCDLPGRTIDLCVSDWNMEPINGLQLLKMLRKEKKTQDIFFIMLTSEQGSDNVIAALQADVDEYIVKPFNQETLKGKIESVAKKKLEIIDKEVSRFSKADESDKGVDSFDADKSKKFVKFFSVRYIKLLSLCPWSPLTPMSFAMMFMSFRKFGEAEKWLRKVIAIDFGHSQAHAILSKAMRKQGKLKESIKELEVALATNPDNQDVRQKLGEAYLKEGNYEKAVVMLSESVKVIEKRGDKTKTAKNLSSLGQARISKGESDKDVALLKQGAKDLEGAVKLDPDLISAQYNLMAAYKKTGKADMALAVFDQIKQMEPKDAEGWVALGKAFLDSDEKSKALFAFKNAEKLAKAKYGVLEEISFALYNAHHFTSALEFNTRAKEENPSEKQSYNIAGLIHRAMGNHKLAIVEYQRSIQIDPDDAALYYNVGVAFIKSGQTKKAEEYFSKAVEKAPSLKEKVDSLLHT